MCIRYSHFVIQNGPTWGLHLRLRALAPWVAVSLGIPVHPPLTAYHQNQYKDTGEHLVVKFATGKTTAQSAYVPHSWEQGRVLGVGLLSNRYVTLP